MDAANLEPWQVDPWLLGKHLAEAFPNGHLFLVKRSPGPSAFGRSLPNGRSATSVTRSTWVEYAIPIATAGFATRMLIDADEPGIEWFAATHAMRQKSRTAANFLGAAWISVDLDYYQKPGYAECPAIDVAGAIYASSARTQVPAPSVVVATGHGLQLLWRLETPAPADDAALVQGVGAALANALEQFGADRCFDLARVARLPGSWNRSVKCGRRAAVPVHTLHVRGDRDNPARVELRELAARLNVPRVQPTVVASARRPSPAVCGSDRRPLRRAIEGCLAGLSRAARGNKHHRLLAISRTVGGLLAWSGQSIDARIVDDLLAALPPGVEDWTRARRTALDGLRFGALEPIAPYTVSGPGHGATALPARRWQPPPDDRARRRRQPARMYTGESWSDWDAAVLTDALACIRDEASSGLGGVIDDEDRARQLAWVYGCCAAWVASADDLEATVRRDLTGLLPEAILREALGEVLAVPLAAARQAAAGGPDERIPMKVQRLLDILRPSRSLQQRLYRVIGPIERNCRRRTARLAHGATAVPHERRRRERGDLRPRIRTLREAGCSWRAVASRLGVSVSLARKAAMEPVDRGVHDLVKASESVGGVHNHPQAPARRRVGPCDRRQRARRSAQPATRQIGLTLADLDARCRSLAHPGSLKGFEAPRSAVRIRDSAPSSGEGPVARGHGSLSARLAKTSVHAADLPDSVVRCPSDQRTRSIVDEVADPGSPVGDAPTLAIGHAPIVRWPWDDDDPPPPDDRLPTSVPTIPW